MSFIKNIIFSKKNFIVLAVSLMALSQETKACSVSVNDLFQKNLLAAYGVGHFGISLTSISGLIVTAYSKGLEEEDPSTLCPQYLRTQATVSFKHSPTKFQTCTKTITVNRRAFIGDWPSGPLETVRYLTPSSSCSIVRLPGRVIHP